MLQTKVKIAVITLKTQAAHTWVNDNICIERRQWTKNEDTEELAFLVDCTFAQELLDEMLDELTENIDFSIEYK